MIRPVALAVLALLAVARADDRAADVQRLLDLLAGTRAHYREAFEDGGEELSSEVDLEEARLLMTDAADLNRRLAILPLEQVDALRRDLDVRTGVASVPERLDAFTATITARTGLVPAVLPPAPPSSARGRVLFQENCALCHGATGAGDGPDTKRLHLSPADFTSVEFMRRETPADFFTMITMGRRKRGMPDWSSLSVQQRWDLIAYVWTLAQNDADRAEGAALWRERCAGCHAGDLASVGRLADRPDRTLFVRLARAPHVDATAGLTDAQRWRLVAHARALSLGGGTP